MSCQELCVFANEFFGEGSRQSWVQGTGSDSSTPWGLCQGLLLSRDSRKAVEEKMQRWKGQTKGWELAQRMSNPC